MDTNHESRLMEVLLHGAYLCLRAREAAAVAAAPVPDLVDRLGLANEFHPGAAERRGTVAFLRRVAATPADLSDRALLGAHAVLHVASTEAATVDGLCAEMARLLDAHAEIAVLRGVVRPNRYTGGLMHELAYEHQVTPRPGAEMPNAFLLPMSKTPEWWAKHWMERHTYFLPRHDAEGRRVAQGHVLAAAPGVPCLLRRTYRSLVEPAPDGEYDFLTYFECADADVPAFHRICAALRDTAQNPEWRFVREGPLWHGHRVATWGELFPRE